MNLNVNRDYNNLERIFIRPDESIALGILESATLKVYSKNIIIRTKTQKENYKKQFSQKKYNLQYLLYTTITDNAELQVYLFTVLCTLFTSLAVDLAGVVLT